MPSACSVSDAAPSLARLRADPDAALDWEDVAAADVSVDASEKVACPVCLEEPLLGEEGDERRRRDGEGMMAPQLTPCGHLYCFTCLMRMLAHAAGTGGAAKCAVCQAVVRTDALRCVRARAAARGDAKAKARYVLVKRRRGSAIALPPEWPVDDASGFPRVGAHPDGFGTDGSLCCPFSKVTLCSAPASDATERALRDVIGGRDPGEAAVAEMCLQALHARDEAWMRRRAVAIASRENPSVMAALTLVGGGGVEGAEAVLRAQQGAPLAAQPAEVAPKVPRSRSLDIAAPTFVPGQSQAVAKVVAQAQFYYAYQLEDGRPRFLHPLSMRLLVHSLGSYESCPPQVTAGGLETEHVVLDAHSRRRWPHLAHLPLGAPAELVEADLPSSLLSEVTRAAFKEELDARAKRREEKSRKEAHEDRKRLEEEERAKSGAQLSAEDFAPLTRVVLEPDFVNDALLDEEAQLSASPQSFNTSFARMARHGFAAGTSPPPDQISDTFWPTLGGEGAAQPAAPVARSPPAGAWGAAARSPPSGQQPRRGGPAPQPHPAPPAKAWPALG